MNNQSIGLANNETFFGSKDKGSLISDGPLIHNDGHTKNSDTSREFRELDREIIKTIQNSGNVSGLSNKDNNTNNSIGMHLLDDTWMNRKSSPDTSENFQYKMNEIKKKAKTPTANKVQQVKHITLINNPQKGFSQFKIVDKNLENETAMKNANYNQIVKNLNDEEDTDDVPSSTEQINKLHINSVKTNNLREINENYRNNFTGNVQYTGQMYPSFNNFNAMNNSSLNEQFECNEEFNTNDNLLNRDLSKKTINPKFMERQNISTRFSTSESNESFDSGNYNFIKFNKAATLEEKLSYNTPVFTRNYPHTPMMQFPQCKKINFNNYNCNTGIGNNFQTFSNNNVNSTANVNPPNQQNFFQKSLSVCIPNYNNGLINNEGVINGNNINANINSNNPNSKNCTTNNNVNNIVGLCPGQGPTININNFSNNKINFQNLPENAFSYNTDNNTNGNSLTCNKISSDKKKIKKSKDEFDQTLFIINTENIIYGRDKRTTVMIRHIPNKYSTPSLLEEINLNFKGKYDFFYLPMDFENQCNLGYAFVNFVDPLHILHFFSVFKARKWKKYKSHKECDLSYAKFQGKVELTSHLEKSCVMNKMGEDKKPIIVTPPDPLPKVEIPPCYSDLFKSIYPHMHSKVIFLK